MDTDSDYKIVQQVLTAENLEGKSVLEVGCGGGRVTSLLTRSSCRLTAIDINERLIIKASKKVSGVNFILSSGERLSFPDDSFDVVIFTLSLHHQDSHQALSEAKRVLKQDGKIIVVEPVEDGEVEKLFALVINENQERRDAQTSILNCGLQLSYSRLFLAEWKFENLEDLQWSPFIYYDMEYDPKVEQKMVDLIGVKSKYAPISLEDKMTIQVLV